MTTLERIAEYMCSSSGFGREDRLALHVLDTVGAWIAGRATEEAAHVARLADTKPLAVLGNQALDRVVLRVATARLSEIDDIHLPSCTTPGSVVVPAALTMAASLASLKARTFAQSLRSGYGIMAGLGMAIAGPSVLYRGVWPTYFLAPLATAAVTARMLDLNATRTANAIAIALTMTSAGVGDPEEIIPRWALIGLAARNGCVAAGLAAEGFSGDRRLLDGGWLSRVHGIAFDADVVARSLPEISALSMKPYCAAKQTIAAMEAFRGLLEQGLLPDEMDKVRVSVPPAYYGMVSKRELGTRTGRIISVAYHLAAAAYRPETLLDVTRPDLSGDSRVAKFMDRVEVAVDPELVPHFPQAYPARVEVTLRSGRSASVLVAQAEGDPERPFSEPAARAKFHCLADPAIGRAEADALADACLACTTDDIALATVCRYLEQLDSTILVLRES